MIFSLYRGIDLHLWHTGNRERHTPFVLVDLNEHGDPVDTDTGQPMSSTATAGFLARELHTTSSCAGRR